METWKKNKTQLFHLITPSIQSKGGYFTSVLGVQKTETFSRADPEGDAPEFFQDNQGNVPAQVFLLRPQDIYSSICGDWNRELF